jgi:hypothetical protein
MDDYKYQLVLQLPGTTQQDYDALLGLEESLADALAGTPHEVDGHDFGSGTGNIFIHTDDPTGAFALVKEIVSLAAYPVLKAAYRSFDEDDYQLIWPENSDGEFNLI